MKKVLVTGAFGFIGFHLCEALTADGIEVIAIDEMPANKKDIQEEMHLRIGRSALIEIISEKLERVHLPTLLEGVDTVFHLAASTSTDSKWSQLEAVIENNVRLTRTLIEAMRPNTRLIYSSTVEVYGERSGVVTEQTPTNPTTPYGITKLASENTIKKLCPKFEVEYVIMRLPTIYGPWQREDMTYQQLIQGNNKPLIDRSTIDVLYVGDGVAGMLSAAKTEAVNEIFHLSSGMEHAWRKGLQILAPEESVIDQPIYPISLSFAKAKKLLGFQPKTTLKEGLKKQCAHIEQLEKQKKLFDKESL